MGGSVFTHWVGDATALLRPVVPGSAADPWVEISPWAARMSRNAPNYRRVASGIERTRAIIETCETQMRPVVMTCIIAAVGLLPAAVSTGIGSQVQKPLAMVVVGGMLFAPVLILIILPVLILAISDRKSMVAPSRKDTYVPAG